MNEASQEPQPEPVPEATAVPMEELSPLMRTVVRIEEGMQNGQSHCLQELVEIIHNLSTRATDISISELAELIEKHVAVMARVIGAANTFGYNPGGSEVSTVKEAIHLIGFDRIRTLVTSMILVRHAASNDQLREQKSAALMAVCAGLTAQSIAHEQGIVDPELAFITASLRQLGRLLLTSYLSDDYRAAVALSFNRSENEAFTEVFGGTVLEVGHEVLSRANFPRRLLDTLSDPDPKGPRRSQESIELAKLNAIAEKLCILAMDRAITTEDFNHRAEQICLSIDRRGNFGKEQLKNLIGGIGDKLSLFTTSLGFGGVAHEAVNSLRWRSGRHRIESAGTPAASAGKAASPGSTTGSAPKASSSSTAAQPAKPVPRPGSPLSLSGRSGTETPAPPPAREQNPREAVATPPPPLSRPASSSAATTPSGSPSEEEGSAPQVPGEVEIKVKHWRDGLVSLTSYLGDSCIDMSALHSLSLDFVRQGFSAPEAVLLRVDNDRRFFVPTNGVGNVFRQVRGDRVARADERTVLGVCISRKENVAIHNTSDPKTLPYVPIWCGRQSGWGAFIAIPMHDHTGCFGVMLIAWAEPLQITLSAENAKLLRSIVATVAAARRLLEH